MIYEGRWTELETKLRANPDFANDPSLDPVPLLIAIGTKDWQRARREYEMGNYDAYSQIQAALLLEGPDEALELLGPCRPLLFKGFRGSWRASKSARISGKK